MTCDQHYPRNYTQRTHGRVEGYSPNHNRANYGTLYLSEFAFWFVSSVSNSSALTYLALNTNRFTSPFHQFHDPL